MSTTSTTTKAAAKKLPVTAHHTFLHNIAWFRTIHPVYVMLMESALIFTVTIVVSAIVFFSAYGMKSRFQKSKRLWDDTLVIAIHLPLQIIIWVSGISYIFETFAPLLPNMSFMDTVNSVRSILIIVAVFWGILRFIKKLEKGLMAAPPAVEGPTKKKKRVSKTAAFAVSRILRIITGLIAILIILQVVGIPISGLLAIGGASTLVVGLAGQAILANFFGGLMIYMDRPFSIGDWIRSPDRNIEGTVEEISWRLTRVRTFDKRPLYIPNAAFSTISVENPSRMRNRRIKTSIGVRYNDAHAIRVIRDDITNMLREHPGIDSTQTLFVRFYEFGESSLNIRVYTFTKTINWVEFMEVQEDVYLRIIDIVTQHGAEIAFPTRTLEMANKVAITTSETP